MKRILRITLLVHFVYKLFTERRYLLYISILLNKIDYTSEMTTILYLHNSLFYLLTDGYVHN